MKKPKHRISASLCYVGFRTVGVSPMAHNGFGIGAVSNVETASRFGLGKFRSSATASKFRPSLIAPNAMIAEVARALASEMKIVKKLIAESDSKN